MPVELAFEDVGHGPPLVLVHGLYGSSGNWRRIARALSARHRVISVDLRNHGASPWTDTMTYPEMADDLAALFERLGLDRPALLGHSMGGKAAMTLALGRPARVGALIVADIAPVAYPDHFTGYTRAMRDVDVAHATGRDAVKRALLASIPEERVVDFLMTNLVRRDDGYAWRIHLAALADAMPVVGGWPERLDGLRYDGPVTVIAGARSTYVGDDDRPRFTRLFPRARFVTIADAGHWLHADRPEAFLAAVDDALSNTTEPATHAGRRTDSQETA